MLKRKMLWVVFSVGVLVCLWLMQPESDQPLKLVDKTPLIDQEFSRDVQPVGVNSAAAVQASGEESVVDEAAELSASEKLHLDEDLAKFKYENLMRLMSTRVDTLDDYQLEMVAQQIIHELPEMVGMGLMHPYDAMLAHVQALSSLGNALESREVESLNQKYLDLYPLSIESGLHDLH